MSDVLITSYAVCLCLSSLCGYERGVLGVSVCLCMYMRVCACACVCLCAYKCAAPKISHLMINKTKYISPGEDPETRRMRTVKNIADLRQNLEETMSSLRGTQITHR